MFNLICSQCGKKFQSSVSRSKFCSPACRVKYFRSQKRKGEQVTKIAVKNVKDAKGEKTTVKTSFKPVDKTFTPNWKRLGYKNKEEAVGHVIDCLLKNKKRILDAGVSNEATFTYQGYTIKLKGKKKK